MCGLPAVQYRLFCFLFLFFVVFIYFGHTNNYNTLHLQFITINSNYQIDLLIGSDYIWDFFHGKSVRGEESDHGGRVVP